MTTATVEPRAMDRELTIGDRLADALASATHLSHEAHLVKSMATDAVEDATRAAKRTVKRRLEDVADFKDEIIHRVKRQPVEAITVAVGVGALIGIAVGWMARGSLRCDANVLD
jgi:ElaB/YqjD/DUF883 family membrane-anchored ribosome-binding protein